MSVQEAEITRQFEGQFAGFEERPPFQPPTANEDIKLSRYLFTAANLITPDVARDRPHMKAGGLNVYNPCLSQMKDFIRRGRITPLLISQHIPIPVEDAPPGDSSYFNVPMDGESLRPGKFEQGGMMSRLTYPGQQIMHILEGSSNGLGAGGGRRLGIVEISTLKGHEYKLENIGDGVLTDRELWDIQRAIFPGYPNLPSKLASFTEMVQIAIDSNSGDIRAIAEEMYSSCVQFEGWAVRHIEKTHQDMAQAAVKGYASPYEQVDIVVLDQLGMRREDEHYKRSAQQSAASAQAAVDPASLVALLEKAGDNNREMFLAGMERLIEKWKSDSAKVDQSTMAAAPIADELKAENFDLSGERPKEVHHKTWEKWQKDAAQPSE